MKLTQGFIRSAMFFFVGVHGSTAFSQAQPQIRPPGRVLLFLSTDCPVAMRQAPRLARLIKEFQGNGLAFQALFPNALESREKVQSFLKARELALEFRLDPGGRLAKRHNVEVVPTAILLDHSGKQVYFGAIDDAKASHQVRVHYLRNAIEDLLAKRKVRVSFGKPFGCYLMP